MSLPQPPPKIQGPSTRSRPGPRTQRIQVIDTLRGFALLGILVMNVIAFANPWWVLLNPTVHGSFEGVEKWIWVVSHVLADQKFMTIFSPLYGAGILLFADNLERRGAKPTGVFLRRSLWLLLFGLLHWILLWDGDILVLYALSGLAVYWLRHRSPAVLTLTGLIVIAVHPVLMLGADLNLPYMPVNEAAALKADFAPSMDVIKADIALRREPYLIQVRQRILDAPNESLYTIALWGFWRAAGLMLMGMAAWKLRLFTAKRSDRTYIGLAGVGLFVGLPIVSFGIWDRMRMGWDAAHTFYGDGNYWASILVSVGYIGIVMLAEQRDWLPNMRRWLAAVGRMAFTNYIMQTMICVAVFQGFGGGLYGTTSRLAQTIFILGVWIFQSVLSVWWLNRFRYGPLEWLWRSLTYGRMEPFRRSMAGVHG